MAGENVFPRRRRAGPVRAVKDPRIEPKRKEESVRAAGAPEAADVARYVADITSQLEAMALAARLDLLAYFLGMAKAESELFVRTNAPAKAPSSGDEASDFKYPTDDSPEDYSAPEDESPSHDSFD